MKNGRCDECGEQAMFFHSKCCSGHMEGVILPDGRTIVVCEKCGLYVGHLISDRKFIGRRFWLGQ